MSKLTDALDAQHNYLLCWGGPNEADHSLNDISQVIIRALADEHDGCAYLGKINKTSLTRYVGQPIFNFEYNFCVPTEDPTLLELLAQWQREPGRLDLFDSIWIQVKALGGQWLLWV